MDNLMKEQPVLKKNSLRNTGITVGTIGIIIAILYCRHNWSTPIFNGYTGATVLWSVVGFVITLGLFIVVLMWWDEDIKKKAAQKDKRHTESLINTRKAATAIERIKRMDVPQWSDILSIARFHTLPTGTPDITAFPQVLKKIHLARMQQLIKPNEKDAGKIFWSGAELHLALTLLEEITRYYSSINDQKELQNLVDQLQTFLKYCKPYTEFDRISKEVKAHCPTLYSMIS